MFFTIYIYYTNSHLAKNLSGNNFFLFYFYLKYYVEDVVCESQAHWNISRIFRVAVITAPPITGPKSTKSHFFSQFFWGIFHNTRNMSCIFNQAISFQKKFQDQPYPLRAIKTKKNTWHRVSHIWKLRNSNKSENDRD